MSTVIINSISIKFEFVKYECLNVAGNDEEIMHIRTCFSTPLNKAGNSLSTNKSILMHRNMLLQ